MVDRRVEVVARLKALEEGAAPLVAFLQDEDKVQELRADKQYNLHMLNDRYQVVSLLYVYNFQLFVMKFEDLLLWYLKIIST